MAMAQVATQQFAMELVCPHSDSDLEFLLSLETHRGASVLKITRWRGIALQAC